MFAKISKDIAGALHGDGQILVGFLHFFVGHFLWPVIGHGGSLDDEIRILASGGDGLKHLPGGGDGNYLGEQRRLQEVGPVTRVTSAPRMLQALARLYPILPEE